MVKTQHKVSTPMLCAVGALALIAVYGVAMTTVGRADNFTDIFYTNSFRGAFEWFKKLDWLGMLVQIVISVFSLLGVCLFVIRLMTSMLYLSAKQMWEQVHELKETPGEGKDFIGMFGMAKSWAKGKSGTGLDAVIGAVLMLLPDIKEYSDFSDKHKSDKFTDDMTISQYMLKIALPAVMTVFFFAMGFNGTLFQALAVTVDAMGSIADRAVSVNYAGFIDDFIDSNGGYTFVFESTGTNEGKIQQSIANDLYAKTVRMISGADADTLYKIGQNVETWVSNNINAESAANARGINETVKSGLSDPSVKDQFMGYIGYTISVNGNSNAVNGEMVFDINQEGMGGMTLQGEDLVRGQYAHITLTQTRNNTNNYYNLGG